MGTKLAGQCAFDLMGTGKCHDNPENPVPCGNLFCGSSDASIQARAQLVEKLKKTANETEA